MGSMLSGFYHDGATFVLLGLGLASVPTNATRFVLNGGLFRSDATAASLCIR